MKLLLVDDEWITRDGIIEKIEWEKVGIHQVQEAEDGVEALEVAEQLQPDILLTDVRMPRMNGVELAYLIKQKFPNCYIIFMSGYTDKEYMKAAIDVSATAYVEKPINIVELKEAINKAIILYTKDRKIDTIKHQLDHSLLVLKHELALQLLRKDLNKEVLSNLVAYVNPEMNIGSTYVTLLILPHFIEKDDELATSLLFRTLMHTVEGALMKEGCSVIMSIKDRSMVVAHCLIDQNAFNQLTEVCFRLSITLNKQFPVELAIGMPVTGIFNVIESYSSALSCFGESLHEDIEQRVHIFNAHDQNEKISLQHINRKKTRFVTDIKQYIEEHYGDENMSLQKISKHMYLTPSYICVLFKDEMNTTINQYISQVRIEHAKEMLKDERLKVKDISTKVGYVDSNYFTKIFKKLTGLTPQEYRELIAQ